MDTFQYFGDYYLYFTITAFTAYIYLAGIYYSNRKKVRELDAQEEHGERHGRDRTAPRRIGEHAARSGAQLLGALVAVPADQEPREWGEDEVGGINGDHHQEAHGDCQRHANANDCGDVRAAINEAAHFTPPLRANAARPR
jgi:hypothetical protein